MRWILVPILLALAGCAGVTDQPADDDDDSADAGPSGPAFDDTFALFVGGRCDRCHTPDATDNTLDLSARDVAYADLVDVVSDGGRCGDGAHTRVIPGDADASLLYQKVAFTFECGLGMPLSEGPGPPGSQSPPLTDEELAIVRDWINGGANDH